MKFVAFERLILECIKRYKDATIKTHIIKVDQYCKSVIWSTFDSYQMDFNGFLTEHIMEIGRIDEDIN